MAQLAGRLACDRDGRAFDFARGVAKQSTRGRAGAAARARCGDGAVPPRTRGIQQGLAKLHRGIERVLESDFGKAAISQYQALAWRADFDFRLCAHAAAGLYRPAEAAPSA